MAKDAIKEELTDIVEQTVINRGWNVQRVDYRTLLIKIPQDGGGPKYYTIQVKELY